MPCPCWAQARNCRTRAQARNCSLFRAWQQTAARHSQGWPQDRSGRQISEAGLRVKKHLSSKLYNAGVGGSSQGPLGRGNWENRQPWQPQAPACPHVPRVAGRYVFLFAVFLSGLPPGAGRADGWDPTSVVDNSRLIYGICASRSIATGIQTTAATVGVASSFTIQVHFATLKDHGLVSPDPNK